MPIYFFHPQGGVAMRDEDGTDLPDIDQARAEATRMMGQQLCDLGMRRWRDVGAWLWDRTEWRMDVADERGQILFVLRFSAENVIAPTSVAGPPQAPKNIRAAGTFLMTPSTVTISTERLAYLEARIVALDSALADYAGRYGMSPEARRLLTVDLLQPDKAL